jgi:nucleoside-diphosphate-sugar epimerase
VNDTDELYPLDVSDLSKLPAAIEGSEIVYVTIGFAYNLGVWQEVWPPFINAVIDACRTHGAKLVFFDNVYLYADAAIPFMTEESPVYPSSRKGAVREEVFQLVMNEVEQKKLSAMVVRAADFYGPDNKNGMLAQMVIKNFLEGKKAQAFGDPDCVHTFTYTPDAGKATALLGNTPDAYDQVWHLPTTKELLTSRQWIELFAAEMGMEPRIQKVPNWMIHLLGLFIPVMREFPEMVYQYDQDYIFDSSKFEKRFGMMVTPPAEGVKATLKGLI